MKKFYLILDNIRSALNVGSAIRTAESAGVDEIFLCGITPGLNDQKVLKTSLGAEKSIQITQKDNTLDLINELKNKKIKIYSLELDENAINYNDLNYEFPMALIVGNEVSGISNEILDKSDKIIEIPMRGKKNSLNVAVATGIAVYKITNCKF